MREFLEGYKGSTRKFMAPVSESRFNADVMEFKDSNNNTSFIIYYVFELKSLNDLNVKI